MSPSWYDVSFTQSNIWASLQRKGTAEWCYNNRVAHTLSYRGSTSYTWANSRCPLGSNTNWHNIHESTHAWFALCTNSNTHSGAREPTWSDSCLPGIPQKYALDKAPSHKRRQILRVAFALWKIPSRSFMSGEKPMKEPDSLPDCSYWLVSFLINHITHTEPHYHEETTKTKPNWMSSTSTTSRP